MVKYDLFYMTANASPVNAYLLIVHKIQNDGWHDAECWNPGTKNADTESS